LTRRKGGCKHPSTNYVYIYPSYLPINAILKGKYYVYVSNKFSSPVPISAIVGGDNLGQNGISIDFLD
jgi:hypothetical protein